MDARAPLDAFVRLSSSQHLLRASAGALLVGLLAYLGLASRAPGAALLVTSAGVFLAILGLVLRLSPVEHKITIERQAEVVGYRLAGALVVHFVLGLAILWGLNSFSAEQARVPIGWDAPFTQPWRTSFLRRVSFWPFYALLLVGCHGLLPTPPGAC